MEQLESLRAEKAAKRGGFEKKLLLKDLLIKVKSQNKKIR